MRTHRRRRVEQTASRDVGLAERPARSTADFSCAQPPAVRGRCRSGDRPDRRDDGVDVGVGEGAAGLQPQAGGPLGHDGVAEAGDEHAVVVAQRWLIRIAFAVSPTMIGRIALAESSGLQPRVAQPVAQPVGDLVQPRHPARVGAQQRQRGPGAAGER